MNNIRDYLYNFNVGAVGGIVMVLGFERRLQPVCEKTLLLTRGPIEDLNQPALSHSLICVLILRMKKL